MKRIPSRLLRFNRNQFALSLVALSAGGGARPNRFSLGCQSDRFEKIIEERKKRQNKRKICFKNKSARKSAREKVKGEKRVQEEEV